MARKLGVQDQIRFLEPPIHAQNLYVGFAKTSRLTEIADKFSESLSDFKKTDDYTRILQRYGLFRSEMTGE